MPSQTKGPVIVLAQFAGNAAPFNSLPAIACRGAAGRAPFAVSRQIRVTGQVFDDFAGARRDKTAIRHMPGLSQP